MVKGAETLQSALQVLLSMLESARSAGHACDSDALLHTAVQVGDGTVQEQLCRTRPEGVSLEASLHQGPR
eukprot:2211735-Rhodomonas_salina.1